ncbi:MAG TPA: glycosyltransferase family 9 protein [Vicinamibacteria bacterium]|nr:glycosyltransferase family 9 protein [Vicinamibacteria bacterium]
MSRRRRWTPVSGTGNRVYEARERLALLALDLPGRALLGGAAWLRRRRARALERGSVREVLVLRLDRMGDLLMSLPALADLRSALPQARIRLAVPAWSAEVARSAPVDEVLVWSPPWAGRAQEGADGWTELMGKARALRHPRLDLALDLQGDVRASLLLRLTGARERVGYANTGGAYLLTRVVPLDETVSWVEQNRRAVAVALGGRVEGAAPASALSAGERAQGARLLEQHAARARPLVGLHPSGGRAIKQWDLGRWAEVAARLQREFGATVVLTGSAADAPLAARVAAGLPAPAVDLTGRLGVRETMAVIAGLDLFLSPDTGPMHMAAAVGTPSVSVFGPSDPGRYFSGGSGQSGARHVVVRADLWCSPCNLIRRPPAECAGEEGPECLRLVAVDAVHREAVRLLREVGGYR